MLAVLLFHGGKLTGGYLGVDAFFVLSGFLITSLLLAEHRDRGRVALGSFWMRRARRLMPALVIALLGVAIYTSRWGAATQLDGIRGDALATTFYIANWHQLASPANYFALFQSPSPLLHTWSLAIEEQFYLLWPSAFVAFTRHRSPRVAATVIGWVAVALTAVSITLAQVMYSPDSSVATGGTLARYADAVTQRSMLRAYLGTDTRMAALLMGCALASWSFRAERASQWTGVRTGLEIAATAAVAGLGVAWVTLDATDPALYRGGLIACGLATSVVIASGVDPRRGVVSRMLSFAPLRALGLISYGLYLYHWPVYLVLDTARTGLDGWSLLFVRFAASLGIATVSYFAIEQPVRRGLGSPRRFVVAIAVAVIAAIGATVGATATTMSTTNELTTRSGGLLVVGDSVAGSLVPGFRAEGFRVSSVVNPGCRMLEGEVVDDVGKRLGSCPWRRAIEAGVNDADPDLSLLVTGNLELFDIRLGDGGEVVSAGSDAWNEAFRALLREQIEILTAGGSDVLVATIACQGERGGRFEGAYRAPIDRVRAANRVIREVVAANPDQLELLDIDSLVCGSDGQERPGAGREDGVHFSLAGARGVARASKATVLGRAPAGHFGEPGVGQRATWIVGDSLVAESQPTITKLLADRNGIWPTVLSVPGGALCDIDALVEQALRRERPDLVVLETHGGYRTDCFVARGSVGPTEDGYAERYRSDLQTMFDRLTRRGIDVIVVLAPPDPPGALQRAQDALAEVIRTVALDYEAVTVTAAPSESIDGEGWSERGRCEPIDRSVGACRGGVAILRAPDGVHFCPAGYEPGVVCAVHSPGAHRYGSAIADVVIEWMAANGTEERKVEP